jgi:hypothetical protein
MANKDLQRVTESVSYIGHASPRYPLPSRRNHITQKVRIAGQRTLFRSGLKKLNNDLTNDLRKGIDDALG